MSSESDRQFQNSCCLNTLDTFLSPSPITPQPYIQPCCVPLSFNNVCCPDLSHGSISTQNSASPHIQETSIGDPLARLPCSMTSSSHFNPVSSPTSSRSCQNSNLYWNEVLGGSVDFHCNRDTNQSECTTTVDELFDLLCCSNELCLPFANDKGQVCTLPDCDSVDPKAICHAYTEPCSSSECAQLSTCSTSAAALSQNHPVIHNSQYCSVPLPCSGSSDDCACCEAGCPPSTVSPEPCLECVPSPLFGAQSRSRVLSPSLGSNSSFSDMDANPSTPGVAREPLNEDIVWINKELEELIRCCCCDEPTPGQSLPTHHANAHPTHHVDFNLFENRSQATFSHPVLPIKQNASPVPIPSANIFGQKVLRENSSQAPFRCQWQDCNAKFSANNELVEHVNLCHLFQTPCSGTPARSRSEYTAPKSPQPRSVISTSSSASSASYSTSLALLDPALYDRSLEETVKPVEKKADPPSHDHLCRWGSCIGKTFATTAELTEHISTDHVGSGKSHYSCMWADCYCSVPAAADGIATPMKEGTSPTSASEQRRKTFNQRQKVMRHLQVHTGDRPFECELCDKKFGEMATLVQHRRTHTHEKPYKCQQPQCGKSFALQSALTIHTRTHTGLKPFQCPVDGCQASFSESSNLSKHMRTHTGARPFECVQCGKNFARSDQLVRHKKIHTKSNTPKRSLTLDHNNGPQKKIKPSSVITVD